MSQKSKVFTLNLFSSFLSLSLSLSSCSEQSALSRLKDASPQPPIQWLVLYYGMGDNNLSAEIRNDISEMEKIGSTPTAFVVGQADFSSKLNSESDRRFALKLSPNANFESILSPFGFDKPVKSFPELDSGSPEVLADFIRWAVASYPAAHRALILSGHGYGYAARVRHEKLPIPDPESSEKTSNRSGFRYFSHDEYPAPGFAGKSILTTVELASVLEGLNSEFSVPDDKPLIDVIVADSCVSQTIENAYALRRSTLFYVASQEAERASGHDYKMTMTSIQEASRAWNPLTREPFIFGPQRFAEAITDGYGKQNLKNTQLSVVNVRALEPVVLGLKQFAIEMLPHTTEVEKWMRDRTPYFGGVLAPRIWVDIRKMAYDFSVNGLITDATRDLILQGIDKAVTRNIARGPGSVGMTYGLSVTLPGKRYPNPNGPSPTEDWEIEVEL